MHFAGVSELLVYEVKIRKMGDREGKMKMWV
jgi:hypothetical protein